ncbi:MAG: type II secretion system protein [Armatimonadota bacterium]|nr:type II secretion system protein [Armatimonadota bacterium]
MPAVTVREGRGERGLQGGFSLVEAVAALVLVGVLLAAALPAWQRNVAYKRLVMAQLVLVEDLRAAEQRARSERTDFCVRVVGGSPARVETGRGACADAQVVQVTDLPPGIAPQQPYEVGYDPLGRATAGAEWVLLDAYGRSKTVQVRQDGRVEPGP